MQQIPVDSKPDGLKQYIDEVLASQNSKQLLAQVASASISPNGKKPIRIRNNGNWHKSNVSSSHQNAQSILHNILAGGDLDQPQQSHPDLKSASGRRPAQAKTLRNSLEKQTMGSYRNLLAGSGPFFEKGE